MKKLIIIVLPILLLLGGGFFAATKGLIKIPGITPPAKKKGSNALYGEAKDKLAANKKKTPEKPKKKPEKPVAKAAPPKPTADPVLGRKKLAKVWNEMENGALLAIAAEWKDDELAEMLAIMSSDKVTSILAEMATKDAKRAAKLSRQIQTIASKIPTDAPTS